MQPTNNLILVCAGADSSAAMRHDLPILQLCLGVGEGGSIRRLNLPARLEGCYLGVSDLGISGKIPEFCAESLVYEAQKHRTRGVFADFEQTNEATRSLLASLDKRMHKAGLPLFAPACQAEVTAYAWLVTETAISGGSLDEHIQGLQSAYPGRIAATLRPVSADFRLPAEDSEGRPVTAKERAALREAYGSQAFFSRELCAKYFTYMDEDKMGHFVLYDDESTIEAKLNRLEGMGVSHVFALYPDVARLL